MEKTVENPARLTVDLDDLISRLQEMRPGAKVGEGADSKSARQTNMAWTKALATENCVEIRDMLVEAGDGAVNLMTSCCTGWPADDGPAPGQLQLSMRPGKREPVQGFTPLHVAARRGDVKLVEKILKMTVEQNGRWKDCFLGAKHPEYLLDAKAMAVINGNQDIVKLLSLAASRKGAQKGDNRQKGGNKLDADENSFQEKEGELRKITMEALNKIRSDKDVAQEFHDRKIKEEEHDPWSDEAFYKWFLQKISYSEDCDFNFLDFQLYLFHFTFSRTFDKLDKLDKLENPLEKYRREIQNGILSEATEDPSFLRYLLSDLKDGQGRTAAHVAVDCSADESSTIVASEYFAAVGEGRRVVPPGEFLNVLDSAGRTPLHRAVANGNIVFLHQLCGLPDVTYSVDFKSDSWKGDKWKGDKLEDDLDIDKLSWDNGFKSRSLWAGSAHKSTTSSALHLAIIHKRREAVKQLLYATSEGYTCKRTFLVNDHIPAVTGPLRDTLQNLSAMQLAVLVEDVGIVYELFKQCDKKDVPADEEIPSFLLAAETGNPTLLALFLDSQDGNFDPFITDPYGRTAFHYVLKKKRVFHPHLLDFVSCQHVLSWRRQIAQDQTAQDARNLSPEDELKTQYAQRKGAIVALLQAGVDIWKEDFYKAEPRLEPGAPEDFVTWWYEKVVKEAEEEQQSLNAAANAISVTAALVATTSYVGPLQPPLGYGAAGVQLQIVAVRVFFVCDTISFYLALAAIMLSLVPALPQPPRISIFKVLARTRVHVALAISCLFPSMISILGAFAAGSIAVAPDHGLSYHGAAIATLGIGGFICFVVIGWFAQVLRKVVQDTHILQRPLGLLRKPPPPPPNDSLYEGSSQVRNQASKTTLFGLNSFGSK